MMFSRKDRIKLRDAFINDKGSALLTVLVLLLIFTIIASSILISSMNNLNVAKRMSEYEDSYYIAEANAQYALNFLKEEVTDYYMFLYNIDPRNAWEYQNALAAFYPSIVSKVCTDVEYSGTCEFMPLNYTDEGINVTVSITVDPNTPLPVSNFGEEGNTVRFLIECIAESDKSRRVVNAVLEIDDPDIKWNMTSAPPMTDMRMLIGNEIVLTDDEQDNEYNSIFCRGSALIAYKFVPEFLKDHEELLNTFTYEYSNAVPTILNWDLDYEDFPTHIAFDSFESLFSASTPGTTEHDALLDWEYETIDYDIKNYSPRDYPSSQVMTYDMTEDEANADYYITMPYYSDSRRSTRYMGTSNDPVRIYSVGDMYISGTKSFQYCYIYARGYVKININGSIKNSIIISGNEYVYIRCDYISNSTHQLIQAKYDVDIIPDYGKNVEKAVIRSLYGKVTVKSSSSYAYKKKIKLSECYIYTNPDYTDAMIEATNAYFLKSYLNSGKDIVLRNCSGQKSSFYARGTTDYDMSRRRYYDLYSPTGSASSYYCDYNNFMQYGCYGYFERWYRGIIFVSTLGAKAGTSFQYENAYKTCDFTTGESIFLSDPAKYLSNHSQITYLYDCRILADREVLIEDIEMEKCYTYAGIRGYEDEQDYYMRYGVPKLYVVRGIYMRVDHTHNEIDSCVFYSKGRMMYSQHTPDSYYPVSPDGKVRVFSSFFYSQHNFEYNGVSTSQGLNTEIMRNNGDYCNNMIIMTEKNLGPHEYSPSVANDVVFIGGDLGLDPDKPHYSQTLFELIGGPTTKGRDGSVEVQCEYLYENYFEQMLSPDEIQKDVPTFSDVFIFDDIYEKKEAENGGE